MCPKHDLDTIDQEIFVIKIYLSLSNTDENKKCELFNNKKGKFISHRKMKMTQLHHLFVIFRILEEHYLLPYLPKQSLKRLVCAEGSSGLRGPNKHRSALLSVVDKCASQHGTAAAAWRLLRKLEQDGMFNPF